jgi:hypothetical protein
MIDIEMRRVLDWLEHDRPRFWRTQVRVAMDDVTAARAALHRCLMYPVADERPSCHEERAALKKAQARLAYCEQKAERLRHWIREVRHEMFEYDGRISQLAEMVEFDVPRAVAILAKLLTRLEEYQAIRMEAGEAAGEAASAAGAALADELWPAAEKENKQGDASLVDQRDQGHAPDALQKKDSRPLSENLSEKRKGHPTDEAS